MLTFLGFGDFKRGDVARRTAVFDSNDGRAGRADHVAGPLRHGLGRQACLHRYGAFGEKVVRRVNENLRSLLAWIERDCGRQFLVIAAWGRGASVLQMNGQGIIEMRSLARERESASGNVTSPVRRAFGGVSSGLD